MGQAKLSDRLKQLREEKKLLQKDLSTLLGISVSTYSNYEQGRRQPDFETLIKLTEYFNVTTDYLLGVSDYRNIDEIQSLAALSESVRAAESKLSKEELSLYNQICNGILNVVNSKNEDTKILNAIKSIINCIGMTLHAYDNFVNSYTNDESNFIRKTNILLLIGVINKSKSITDESINNIFSRLRLMVKNAIGDEHNTEEINNLLGLYNTD